MNYDTLSIKELRQLATEAGLTIKSRSKAPIIAALVAANSIQTQEELQHETLAVEEVVTVDSREQAENYVIEMDMIEAELQQATTYELFESCKRSLEMMKAEITALGYTVERCVTGWQLKVEEVAQVASPVTEKKVSVKVSAQEKKAAQEDAKLATLMETLSFHEDSMGLYARVPSANPDKPDTVYEVRVCAKRMLSTECSCPNRGDCLARLAVDRRLDGIRPTLSEQIEGVFPSRDKIEALIRGGTSRYDAPLRGSGIQSFRSKAIEQRLQEAA